MLDILQAAAAAAHCAIDSSVPLEDGGPVVEELVMELLWRPACSSLHHLRDFLLAPALFVRQHSSVEED